MLFFSTAQIYYLVFGNDVASKRTPQHDHHRICTSVLDFFDEEQRYCDTGDQIFIFFSKKVQQWFSTLLEQLINSIESKNLKLATFFKVDFSKEKIPNTDVLQSRLEYDRHDFETAADWSETFLTFRNQLVRCYKEMTRVYPLLLLAYLEAKTQKDITLMRSLLSSTVIIRFFC